MILRLFLLIALGLGLYAPAAHAQTPANCGVNYNPVVGVNCANVRRDTYVGQMLGLIPAAGATDFYCIDASASRTITIRRVTLSGTATAIQTPVVSMIRRNTLDTGGTAGTTPFITAFNSANPTSTATVIYYTANPTITDSTSHQTIRASVLTLTPTTAAAGDINTPLTWEFGTSVDAYNQGAVLAKGSTQQFCLNWGAATTAGNSVNGTVEWTEE